MEEVAVVGGQGMKLEYQEAEKMNIGKPKQNCPLPSNVFFVLS